MPTVSLTMIVRNEAANLPGCLASCAGLFDELIIVDTGSTDRTKEIAASFKDKHGRWSRVFGFDWCDDFAAARNGSVQVATSDWVFWMDADDLIPSKHNEGLRELFEGLGDPTFYLMGTVSATDENADGFAWEHGGHRVRLAPRLHCRWTGRLHEQIDSQTGLPCIKSEIDIIHKGYLLGTNNTSKHDRNLRIASKWADDCPTDPAAIMNLARCLGESGQHEESMQSFERLFGLLTRRNNPCLWTDAMIYFARAAAVAGLSDTLNFSIAELESSGIEYARSVAAEMRKAYLPMLTGAGEPAPHPSQPSNVNCD